MKEFELCLDSRLVAFGGPLCLTLDGKARVIEIRPSFRTLCASMRVR